MDASANTMYFARYHSGNAGWELFKLVANVATQLGSTVPLAFPSGQQIALRLTMVDTTISMQVNGVTVVSVSDNAISAAGLAGFRQSGAANAAGTGIHIASILAR